MKKHFRQNDNMSAATAASAAGACFSVSFFDLLMDAVVSVSIILLIGLIPLIICR